MAEEQIISIGEVKKGNIKITVSEFNGQKYLDIRKYFDDDGELKPTKKGIALSAEQFEAVLDILTREKDHILKELS
ncbi:transcriptional coactivator p15/PC4 family protein [Thermospira aquatica]|uniref:Transcriptional coactivator p15/PC4 family protein n=1 Tax=Thermospira aquatica TaxID=2828656 RepID=A0AAX3BIT4_9SPIR|nr:transcriptional coactivator p15/PC4 family protein [Thermospira aquatica]URA11251.1 transcriptional coactivator p15/PC4 family protein [Thermospira aquatica]